MRYKIGNKVKLIMREYYPSDFKRDIIRNNGVFEIRGKDMTTYLLSGIEGWWCEDNIDHEATRKLNSKRENRIVG